MQGWGGHRRSSRLGVATRVEVLGAADAWRLEAEGRAEAAAAAAVAAQRARDAVRQAAPRPITDPSPLPPAGLLPTLPPEAPSLPGPTDPGPPGESGQGPGDPLPAPPEDGGRYLRLGEVDPILVSEVLADLTASTAASTEKSR